MPMLFERQERESAKAFAAFKTYLELGPDRSLVLVADKLGKSKTMIERWSRKFDWPARVQAHTAHLADVERKAAEAVATQNGVDWAKRQERHREDEWQTRTELIGLPTVRFGEIAERIEGLAGIKDIFLETTSNNGPKR